VRVMTDAFGSYSLSADFWQMLMAEGGEHRRFRLPGLYRFGLRDHRKLLICDEEIAFVNGLNIGPEYAGDGVRQGWRDLGLHFQGGIAGQLCASFDEMFEFAHFHRRRFTWVRHAVRHHRIQHSQVTALISAPGWRHNPMVSTLMSDFGQAKSICILCAYFLPTFRLLRGLCRAARRGARVQLILAGKSDMAVMQMATRGLYRKLLKAGVEIYEYQPQILHAKMIIVDDRVVYAGSANLDVRSLHLNYELLIRVENQRLAHEGTQIFQNDLAYSKQIHLKEWSRSRTWVHRILSRVAFFFVGRLDPYLSSGSWHR
jgi:cardiolipin synthase